MLLGRYLPQFLDSKAEYLRSALLTKAEYVGQALGQMPARALGEECVAGVEFHAGLVVRAVAPIASDAHVAGGDALHRAIVVEQDLGGRKSGENLDSKLLRLPRQPAAQIAEAQRVGSTVPHERRHQHFGNAELALGGQHPMVVLGHRNGQRRTLVLPVGDQLIERLGIDHGTGQDVRADFAALFEDAHAKLASGSSRRAVSGELRRLAPPVRHRRSPRHKPWIRVRSSAPLRPVATTTQFDSNPLPIP